MDNLFEQTLLSISEMIKINSEQTQPEKGMPFGRGAAECLEKFLSLASSFGFQTVNYDNYAGEVIFGEGEDFGVLAHLDVVPAGNGWTKEPFGGEIDYTGKRLYGRGAMDDKGPAVILLYCLKSLKDEGFKPKSAYALLSAVTKRAAGSVSIISKRTPLCRKRAFLPTPIPRHLRRKGNSAN